MISEDLATWLAAVIASVVTSLGASTALRKRREKVSVSESESESESESGSEAQRAWREVAWQEWRDRVEKRLQEYHALAGDVNRMGFALASTTALVLEVKSDAREQRASVDAKLEKISERLVDIRELLADKQ